MVYNMNYIHSYHTSAEVSSLPDSFIPMSDRTFAAVSSKPQTTIRQNYDLNIFTVLSEHVTNDT